MHCVNPDTLEPHLVEAMRIALTQAGAPLLRAADLFAMACVTAAVSHPEWAAAVALHAERSISDLGDAIVASSPVAILS